MGEDWKVGGRELGNIALSWIEKRNKEEMKKRKHTFCIFDQEKNFEGKKSEERKFLSATKLNKQTSKQSSSSEPTQFLHIWQPVHNLHLIILSQNGGSLFSGQRTPGY